MKNSGVISDYIRHRGLLVAFVARDIKGRYTGTVLGMFWTLAQPLLMLALYTVVFSVLLNAPFAGGGMGNYALYVFCAIVPWIAFQESLQRAVASLIENANLIKKVAFPSAIIPLHIVISGAINQLPGTVLLVVVVVISKGTFSATLVLLPLVWVLQVAFTAGLAWFLSCADVFFRDVRHIVTVGLLVWMFLTPVFYLSDVVDNNAHLAAWLKTIYNLNPMKLVVDLYRDAILLAQWPRWWEPALLAGYAALAILVGHRIFDKNKDLFADQL